MQQEIPTWRFIASLRNLTALGRALNRFLGCRTNKPFHEALTQGAVGIP